MSWHMETADGRRIPLDMLQPGEVKTGQSITLRGPAGPDFARELNRPNVAFHYQPERFDLDIYDEVWTVREPWIDPAEQPLPSIEHGIHARMLASTSPVVFMAAVLPDMDPDASYGTISGAYPARPFRQTAWTTNVNVDTGPVPSFLETYGFDYQREAFNATPYPAGPIHWNLM
jgi:hypothetical protein